MSRTPSPAGRNSGGRIVGYVVDLPVSTGEIEWRAKVYDFITFIKQVSIAEHIRKLTIENL